MKKIFTLVIAICAIYTANAGNGDNDSKFTLGVSVGAALPMGAYGSAKSDTTIANSNDSTHINNGYAKTGFHFDITAGYLFADNIGGMVYIGGNMNSFDDATYNAVNGIRAPTTSTHTNWYVGQYLVGPFLSLPASDKLKIDIRVLVGLVTANLPTGTAAANDGSGETLITSGNGGSGFGYQLGGGIKYNLSDKMGLTVNIAYTGSTINYTGYKYVYSGPYNATTINTTAKRTMSTGLLTTTVGIAFNL
ncbi:MAG TPA: outer membrane beta-barrel protein [Bacteroidia bacterium]|nr:outer membrane beta-barrel protein [Bacteroidia bacterium]